jgi:hypothetical protein
MSTNPYEIYAECHPEINLNPELTTPTKTIEELIEIAKNIMISIKGKNCDEDEEEYKKAFSEHKDFASSHPLVFRFMTMGKYNEKAFNKYLMKMGKEAKEIYKTKRNFLEFQAEYPVLYYKEVHKGWDKNIINKIRDQTVEQLIEEDETWEVVTKSAQKELEERMEELNSEKKKKLYEHLMKKKILEESNKTD